MAMEVAVDTVHQAAASTPSLVRGGALVQGPGRKERWKGAREEDVWKGCGEPADVWLKP